MKRIAYKKLIHRHLCPLTPTRGIAPGPIWGHSLQTPIYAFTPNICEARAIVCSRLSQLFWALHLHYESHQQFQTDSTIRLLGKTELALYELGVYIEFNYRRAESCVGVDEVWLPAERDLHSLCSLTHAYTISQTKSSCPVYRSPTFE